MNSPPITVADVARFLGIDEGDSSLQTVELTHAAALHEAGPGAITFIATTRPGADLLKGTRASAVIAHQQVIDATRAAGTGPLPILLPCTKPRLGFIRVLRRYFAGERPIGIHPDAIVDATAILGDDAYIGPLVTIGAGVRLGSRSVIHAGVHIYEQCSIGNNVTIHAGTVIGAAGFGYERDEEGNAEVFPHIGTVIIEDNVEIGANACIDRGTLGATTIRSGAMIDNLVHIAHNVEIEESAFVIAHAMIGGGTRVGAASWIAPASCLRDNIEVGKAATVGLGAVVLTDVASGQTVVGNPARDIG